jgi:hypothetical protein
MHLSSLDEVVLHEALEVEVGELILLAELEELSKLGIRVNLAAIGLILKTVGLDVGIELLANVSASHLGSNSLAKEGSKLIADAGGLDETRWLAVDVVTALLGGCLLGSLHLTSNRLLKSLEVVLEGGEESNKLLELSAVLSHLDRKSGEGGIGLGDRSGGLRSGGSYNGLGSLGCSGLLGTGSLRLGN